VKLNRKADQLIVASITIEQSIPDGSMENGIASLEIF
jgi:hypothetical protein